MERSKVQSVRVHHFDNVDKANAGTEEGSPLTQEVWPRLWCQCTSITVCACLCACAHIVHGSQVLAIVPKKGPSKLTQGPFLYYMEDACMPLVDLVNYSGNDEAILFLWLVSVSTDDCGHM